MEAKLLPLFKLKRIIYFWLILNALELTSALSPNPFQEVTKESPFPSQDNLKPCDSNCFNSSIIANAKSINFVCGSDGFTYLNFGELDCVRRSCKRDIHLEYYGRCKRETFAKSENAEGDNMGQTVTINPGTMDRNFLRFLSQISLQPEVTPLQPLIFPSGSGGFSNLPQKTPGSFSSAFGNRKSKKICIPDECECDNEELRPICGSDSVTYGNQCLMDCNKECSPDVIKYHDGHCGKLFLKGGCRPDECGCPEGLQPVCGSDSVTYGNRCLLECSRNCKSDLQMNHEGYCGRLFFSKT